MRTLIQFRRGRVRSVTGFCPVARQLGGIINLPLGRQSQGYPEQEAIDCVTHISLFSFPVSFNLLPHPDLGTISHALVSGSALKPNELRRKHIVVGTYETQDQIREAIKG